MVRRLVMWSAGVVLGLSVAAWGVSLWGVTWLDSNGKGMWLLWGDLGLQSAAGQRFNPSSRIVGHDFRWPDWAWPPWPEFVGDSRGWSAGVPLYPVILIATSALVGAMLKGRRNRILVRAGLCPACAYDLTGITGPCPECGRERERMG